MNTKNVLFLSDNNENGSTKDCNQSWSVDSLVKKISKWIKNVLKQFKILCTENFLFQKISTQAITDFFFNVISTQSRNRLVPDSSNTNNK